jgi:protein associated with RNAse G/E
MIPAMDTDRDTIAFAEGMTVVRRDTLGDRVWTAAPFRVIEDSGDGLVLACWPGIESLAPTTWIESRRTGDDAVRKQAIPNLAARRWELGRWVWRDRSMLIRLAAGEYFSVSHFFGADGRAGGWYVNFERPYRRTRIGIDTFDLLLDLVVQPDLSAHAWKDEDEYAQARRLGLIDDALHRRVEEARQRVVGLIERREGPFARDITAWSPSPDWPTPRLPADALTVPCQPS